MGKSMYTLRCTISPNGLRQLFCLRIMEKVLLAFDILRVHSIYNAIILRVGGGLNQFLH